jgi:dolichyl-phosphate-mannose--protein O-mannosyl transferase
VHVLFYSPLLTALAAALMALDGLLLVHSRTALLDLFLTFFTLLGVLLWHRNRHIWAGIAFGLAIGCKWSAIYFVAIIGLIAVYRVLIAHDIRKTLKPIAAKFAQYGLIPVFVYTLTWTGWFLSDRGWSRGWSNNPLSSWIHYHSEMLNFHTGLTATHPYQANPWSWLIMGRPTSFFYDSPKGCSAENCAQEVLALGTPLLWWVGSIAIAVVVGYWIKSLINHRIDNAANLVVLGLAAGYLPWFAIQDRTMFSFYAIAFEPFILLTLVYVLSKVLKNQRQIAISIGAIVLVNFLYFLPIFLGLPITYNSWQDRMWLPSWI